MPLSRDQFDKGLDNTDYQILDFLKHHPENAYGTTEIMEGVGYYKPLGPNTSAFGKFLYAWAGINTYQKAIASLVSKGAVIEKTVNGMTWYSSKK